MRGRRKGMLSRGCIERQQPKHGINFHSLNASKHNMLEVYAHQLHKQTPHSPGSSEVHQQVIISQPGLPHLGRERGRGGREGGRGGREGKGEKG